MQRKVPKITSVEHLARALHKISHPTKLQILLSLVELDEPVTPMHVACELVLSTSMVSSSLKRMSEAGVLNRETHGKHTFYSVSTEFKSAVIGIFE